MDLQLWTTDLLLFNFIFECVFFSLTDVHIVSIPSERVSFKFRFLRFSLLLEKYYFLLYSICLLYNPFYINITSSPFSIHRVYLFFWMWKISFPVEFSFYPFPMFICQVSICGGLTVVLYTLLRVSVPVHYGTVPVL